MPTKTHGHRRMQDGKPSRIYNVWTNIKGRCLNPSHTLYHWYGAKGITICDLWQFSFEQFLEDVGDVPEGMELDRIDNNKGYEPGNCRWVTHKENTRNRSSTKLTAEKAKQIKEQIKSLPASAHKWSAYTRIGDSFGISAGRVYDIAAGRAWAEVE